MFEPQLDEPARVMVSAEDDAYARIDAHLPGAGARELLDGPRARRRTAASESAP